MAVNIPFLKYLRQPKSAPTAQPYKRLTSELPVSNVNEIEIVRRLGNGSFGLVSLCKKGDDLFVFKELLHKDELSQRLFAKEAKLVHMVSHDNIVKFDSVYHGHNGDDCAFLLEFIQFDFKPHGLRQECSVSSLKDFLKTVDTFNFQGFEHLSLNIVTDICKGLHHLHMLHIAHRDLKPDNVLVSNQHYATLSKDEINKYWTLKPVKAILTDFGESRSAFIQTKSVPSNETGCIRRGSPVYMAPEIHIADRNTKMSITDLMATDMWSYAMVIFMVLNPNFQYPYQMELDSADKSESPMELEDIFREEILPLHGKKYQSLRENKWSEVTAAYNMCAKFRDRPSAHEMLKFLIRAEKDHLDSVERSSNVQDTKDIVNNHTVCLVEDDATLCNEKSDEGVDLTRYRIMPGRMKTFLNDERFCNPPCWQASALKMTHFSPSMMWNIFRSFTSAPQMQEYEQYYREVAIERNVMCETLADTEEVKRMKNRAGKKSKMPDGGKDITCYKDESDYDRGDRFYSEVLSDREVLDLKEAPVGQIRILWIGHASLLIQMEGMNILTDPMFSMKAGPFNSLIGNVRYRRPAVTVEMLRDLEDFKIDAVVISHNHYHHFDKESVLHLNCAFPRIKWFVPKNLKEDLMSLGCRNVTEATWWDSVRCTEGITMHFTPTKHWSGRSPTDWFTSLWGSWVIEGKTAKVYFAGDTGYQEEIFRAIKETFGPITVAALPIGGYEPREFKSSHHINPEEAVKIHTILDAQKSIGILWRTFCLGYERIEQPIHDLELAKRRHFVKEEDFITLETSLITTIDCQKQESRPTQQEGREPN